MKKLIPLLFIFFGITSYAQNKAADQFQLKPEGFQDEVVKKYDGADTEDLYRAVKLWANAAIDNSETAVVKDINEELLQYRIFAPQLFSIEDDGSKYTWDAMFNFTVRFEGDIAKYKIVIVEISSKDAPTFALRGGLKTWAFFALNNEPYELTTPARKTTEDFANNLVESINKVIETNISK